MTERLRVRMERNKQPVWAKQNRTQPISEGAHQFGKLRSFQQQNVLQTSSALMTEPRVGYGAERPLIMCKGVAKVPKWFSVSPWGM